MGKLLVVAAVVGLIVLAGLAVKLVSGIVGGLFNAVLGVVVVLALVAIVIWMFAYAAKHK